MGNEQNKLRFKDQGGKMEIVLFYRDPTVDDWIAYQARNAAEYVEGETRELRFKKMFHSQFEAARGILTGFSANGSASSPEGLPARRGLLDGITMEDPAWKEKLEKKIPQFLITLGRQVFETEDFDAEKNS